MENFMKSESELQESIGCKLIHDVLLVLELMAKYPVAATLTDSRVVMAGSYRGRTLYCAENYNASWSYTLRFLFGCIDVEYGECH
jgi:hypothetical protein